MIQRYHALVMRRVSMRMFAMSTHASAEATVFSKSLASLPLNLGPAYPLSAKICRNHGQRLSMVLNDWLQAALIRLKDFTRSLSKETIRTFMAARPQTGCTFIQ